VVLSPLAPDIILISAPEAAPLTITWEIAPQTLSLWLHLSFLSLACLCLPAFTWFFSLARIRAAQRRNFVACSNLLAETGAWQVLCNLSSVDKWAASRA
jgi:hypothetical protein